MAERKLRVILFTHGGAEKVLTRLAALPDVAVVGVFIETATVRRYPLRVKIERSIRYDGYAATFAKPFRRLLRDNKAEVHRGAADPRESMQALANSLSIPVHCVADYHAAESIALIRAAEPELGVVYGTNILKESVFGIPRFGSINLHRGLVPYYRGGPAIFWELFNGETEAGMTIHYVASKVDAGEVILQETVPLDYDYSCGLDYEAFITRFQEQQSDRCAQLLSEAVNQIAKGTAAPWAQDLSLGKRYRLPVKKEKDELRRRLRERHRSSSTTAIYADRASRDVGK